uniref:TATA box binding protein associated factor (TAF) histone-like fold domain-containing protein n=1 Tax=Gopherus agassizii TaxID=38772 RepID=A0A452HA58_9SAUR
MSEREERRFVELPRESVRLMAESAGLELTDEVAALLAEDVCYRLREAAQVRESAYQSPLVTAQPGKTHVASPVN